MRNRYQVLAEKYSLISEEENAAGGLDVLADMIEPPVGKEAIRVRFVEFPEGGWDVTTANFDKVPEGLSFLDIGIFYKLTGRHRYHVKTGSWDEPDGFDIYITGETEIQKIIAQSQVENVDIATYISGRYFTKLFDLISQTREYEKYFTHPDEGVFENTQDSSSKGLDVLADMIAPPVGKEAIYAMFYKYPVGSWGNMYKFSKVPEDVTFIAPDIFYRFVSYPKGSVLRSKFRGGGHFEFFITNDDAIQTAKLYDSKYKNGLRHYLDANYFIKLVTLMRQTKEYKDFNTAQEEPHDLFEDNQDKSAAGFDILADYVEVTTALGDIIDQHVKKARENIKKLGLPWAGLNVFELNKFEADMINFTKTLGWVPSSDPERAEKELERLLYVVKKWRWDWQMFESILYYEDKKEKMVDDLLGRLTDFISNSKP